VDHLHRRSTSNIVGGGGRTLDLKNFPYVLPAATGATISSACRFADPT
jgi:hypothetical protein